MHRLFGLSLLVCAGTLLAATPPEPVIPQAKAAMARLPLRFEENRGQWDASVRFTARSAGPTLKWRAAGRGFGGAPTRVEFSLVPPGPPPVIEPLDRMPATTN